MVRTRLAPSPTGYLHIGTARTALFNYLFAKKNKGAFILRIEDTDLERSKKEYEDDIFEGLKWLGLQWDEGPDSGGSFGPYRQRERLDLYKKYLRDLADKGLLYQCYCSKEELEKEREIQVLSKQPPKYSGKCSALSDDQKQELEKSGTPSTLRFRVESKIFKVEDLIRGNITFDTSILDDFIVAKDFDTPLYNFAVVIDDYLMQISHVLRGEEHLSNVPKQILIEEALGFPVPQFGHLSLILNADRTKLSKRQNKVSLLEYRNEGYLPEALLNFIALLGWNPGGERELYSLDEMAEIFDLSRVNKSGAVFDVQKLDWFNNQYLRKSDLDKITCLSIPHFISANLIHEKNESCYTITETGENVDVGYLKKIVGLERERVKKLSDIPQNTNFFFQGKLSIDPSLLRWKTMTETDVEDSLQFCHRHLSSLPEESFTESVIEKTLKEAIVKEQKQNGFILWPLRVSLTGMQSSPNPFDVAAILGKAKTLQRITDAFRST